MSSSPLDSSQDGGLPKSASAALNLGKQAPVCPPAIQQKYLKQVQERNQQEKAQFKEVIQHYMEVLKSMKTMQDKVKTLERENYALKQTKG
jgi:hypothetical protein